MYRLLAGLKLAGNTLISLGALSACLTITGIVTRSER
jgi:hypothetical protein